jgi:hypothetical protein
LAIRMSTYANHSSRSTATRSSAAISTPCADQPSSR